MADKQRTWMKIHSGINDPKHREALGVRVWLFFYLIDHVEWDTGVVWGYTDGKAAAEMEVPESTIRKWRRGLQESGYITRKPGFQCSNIYIHKWRNPRLVEPPQLNVPGDESTWCPNLDTHSGTVLDTHPASKVDTPTYRSQSHTPPQAGGGGGSTGSGHHGLSEETVAKIANLSPAAATVAKAFALTAAEDFPELDELERIVRKYGAPLLLEGINVMDDQADPGRRTWAFALGAARRLKAQGWQPNDNAAPASMFANQTVV